MVKVRRKDTGRTVLVSPETLRAHPSDYAKWEEDTHPSPQSPKHQPKESPKPVAPVPATTGDVLKGIRDYSDEPELTKKNTKEWLVSHTATTPSGSVVAGVIHSATHVQKDIVSNIVSATDEALKAGKHVVFLAEGGLLDPAAMDWEPGDDQEAAVKALHRKFGDKIQQDTWDDEPVDVMNPKSSIWKQLDTFAGSPVKSRAQLACFMLGQDDDVPHLTKAGMLTKPIREYMEKNYGIKVTDSPSKKDRAKMYALAFPGDTGKPPTEVSKTGDEYNRLRQVNLVNKITAVEKAGGVVMSTVGASHAWALKPVLEKQSMSKKSSDSTSQITLHVKWGAAQSESPSIHDRVRSVTVEAHHPRLGVVGYLKAVELKPVVPPGFPSEFAIKDTNESEFDIDVPTLKSWLRLNGSPKIEHDETDAYAKTRFGIYGVRHASLNRRFRGEGVGTAMYLTMLKALWDRKPSSFLTKDTSVTLAAERVWASLRKLPGVISDGVVLGGSGVSDSQILKTMAPRRQHGWESMHTPSMRKEKGYVSNTASIADEPQYVLNTSNPRKYAEFVRLGLNYPRTSVDHPEPDSDALTVIRYKASLAGVRVIVEDTSFDIEGAAIGVNARWLSHTVDRYIGVKASLTVLIGVLEPDGLVYVYRGVTHGVIVPPTEGTSFFIDRCFKPFGATKTFAEDKPDRLSPRAKAVQAFKRHRPFKLLKPLRHHEYNGEMQHTARLKQPLRSRPDYGTSDAALPRGEESVEEVVKRHLHKKADCFGSGVLQ